MRQRRHDARRAHAIPLGCLTHLGPRTLSTLLGVLGAVTLGCAREKPPAPRPQDKAPAQAEAKAKAPSSFNPASDQVLLTYAGERGQFQDTDKLDQIPKSALGLVRIAFLDKGKQPPAGQVWVSNLGKPGEKGEFVLQSIPRGDFELAALGTGRKSNVKLPEGLEMPKVVAANDGIIIYKTAWCGVCTKVQQYLKQKGVAFVAKDIEKDRAAAAELSAKAKKAKVATGSVPVIDAYGQLLVGFDRPRLDRLIAQHQAQ